MKRFFYSACGYSAPHIGVIIDEVVTSINKGDEVYWAYCQGALSSCWTNRSGKKSACKLCHRMYKEYASNYAKNVHMIPVNPSSMNHKERSFSFNNPKEIRSFEYRNVKVGMSVLSTYYTFTRDLDINDFDSFCKYCIPLLGEICDMVDYCYGLIDSINPDEIVIFNGRHFSNRFIYDICVNKGIPFKSYEVIGGFNEPPFKKVCFDNALPHSILLKDKKIERLWELSADTLEEKIKVADTFYNKRKSGEVIADVKTYVANQEQGLLPQGFDDGKRNIAIFNSSADEFAAIGGEWDENLLFDSQYEAIKYMLENSSSNLHYYLRIHPNLEGVNHKAHLDLYKLSEYSNITIIMPSDKISTYSLMDKCDKIVTFGSTMGVESCYWGKPSILIGHCAYEMQNVCYIPKTKEELINLMEEKGLAPKPKEGAIKYAYYLLDKKYLVEPTIIDIDIHNKKFVIEFPCTEYLKIFGKSWIFQLAYLFGVRLVK